MKAGRRLRIYTAAVKTAFDGAMAYRTDFVFNFIINLISNMLTPLLTVLIYGQGASIPGWTFHEALLIQSVFMLCTGVCGTFFYGLVWNTMERVREGTFDLLLIKPGTVSFNMTALSFDLEGIGVFAGGLVLFCYSLAHITGPRPGEWLQFLFLFLMGNCVLLGFVFIMAATAFKWVGNSRIFEIFSSITDFGRYPSAIFGRGLLVAVTYVIPIAMTGFLPASALLGRADGGTFLAAVPCLIFLLLGRTVFHRMVAAYQSAGG